MQVPLIIVDNVETQKPQHNVQQLSTKTITMQRRITPEALESVHVERKVPQTMILVDHVLEVLLPPQMPPQIPRAITITTTNNNNKNVWSVLRHQTLGACVLEVAMARVALM